MSPARASVDFSFVPGRRRLWQSVSSSKALLRFRFRHNAAAACHIEKGVEHSVNLGIMDVAENCGDYLSEVLDLQVILCELLIPVQTKRATLQHLQSKNAQFAYPLARFPPFM